MPTAIYRIDVPYRGGSYLSQMHFGLGEAASADLEVRWPSGVVDRLAGVAADRVVTVVEGKGERK